MDKEKEKKNDLVIKLMQEKRKNEKQMAALTGKDVGMFYKITGKKNSPSETTLTIIANALGVNESYWETGVIIDKKLENDNKIALDPTWKDEAYTNLKEEKEYFKQKYEKIQSNYEVIQSKYQRIMEALLSGKKPEELNFPKAPDNTAWMLNNNIHSGVGASIQ